MYSFPAVIVVAASSVVLCASAQPRVAFPISAQVPPVAVANEDFRFTFLAGTFTSELVINYVLEDAPTWLRLDNNTRTLSGKPSLQDVGNVQTRIRALNAAGSVTLNVALVVAEHVQLESNKSAFVQTLAQTGSCSFPATLLLYPQTAFVLNFGLQVFSAVDTGVTHYYAASVGNTPLPAWVAFDPKTVSFSGTTPSLLTPQSSPQMFDFTLIATQIAGFSQSVLRFQISVTNHILAFLHPIQKFNISTGSHVSIPPSLDQLKYDGVSLNRSGFTLLSSNQPGWLTMDDNDLSFSGISPKDLKDTSFNLTVTDDRNNIATTEIQMLVGCSTTESNTGEEILTTDATVDTWFVYQFDKVQVTGAVYDFDFSPKSAGRWLTFFGKNASICGNVPNHLEETAINFTLTIQPNHDTVRVERLIITITSAEDSTNATNTGGEEGAVGGRPNINGPTSTGPNMSDSSSRPRTSAQKKTLALKITLPVLAAIAGSVVVYLLLKRRCKKSIDSVLTATTVPAVSFVSTEDSMPQNGSDGVGVLAGGEGLSETPETVHTYQSTPPRIDLPWSIRSSLGKRSVSMRSNPRDETPTTRSSWDVMLMEVNGSTTSRVTNQYGQSSLADVSAQESKAASEHKLEITRRCPSNNAHILTESQSSQSHGNYLGSCSVPVSMSKFAGRRTSGLGHGTGVADPGMNMHAGLRSVPLSPLAERAFHHTKQNLQPHLTRASVLYNRAEFKGSLRQETSVRGQPSENEAPSAVISSIVSSGKAERPSQSRQIVQPDSETGSVWEDDDWRTESSTPRSRTWHHDDERTGRLTLPSVTNYVVSSIGLESTSSQTNSLRFI